MGFIPIVVGCPPGYFPSPNCLRSLLCYGEQVNLPRFTPVPFMPFDPLPGQVGRRYQPVVQCRHRWFP